MSEKIDVLVIGAGPAGSVSASMLHQSGYSVRVVEREKFPRFVIGESLLPRCMEVLEEAKFLNAVHSRRKKPDVKKEEANRIFLACLFFPGHPEALRTPRSTPNTY